MTIYSGTEFFNELDILEIRLETMSPYVDYFIISESTRTHAGGRKPLFFLENKKRFKRFNDKIIHQIIEDTPINYEDLDKIKPRNEIHEHILHNIRGMYWVDKYEHISFIRDAYEKECISFPLESAKPDDIIIISDLDEIPREEKIREILNGFDPNENYLFQNDLFCMYLNLQKTNEPWWGANMLTVENMLLGSISKMRQFKEGKKIENGGWHFTYMGGAKSMTEKIESFAHQEFNFQQLKDKIPYIFEHVKELGVDSLGRPSSFIIRDINDGTFPQFIVDNQERLKDLILV